MSPSVTLLSWGCCCEVIAEKPDDEGFNVMDDEMVVVLARHSKYDMMYHRDTEDDIKNTNPDVLKSLTITQAFHSMMKAHVTIARETQHTVIDIFVYGLIENSFVFTSANEVTIVEICMLVDNLKR